MAIPAEMKDRLEVAKQFMADLGTKSDADIVAAFEQTKAEFLAELDGLSSEQIEFRPTPDRWSIREVCLHVSQVMRGVGGLMQMLGAGMDLPRGVKAEPGTLDDDPGDFDTIQQMVVDGFDAALGSAKTLGDVKAPDKTFPHPWFGELNTRGWAIFNVLHGNVHVNQLRKNKEADAYPG